MCAICGKPGANGGYIGRAACCATCYNRYATPPTVASVRETLVRMDQELESDSRLLDVRKQLAETKLELEKAHQQLAKAREELGVRSVRLYSASVTPKQPE